METFAETKQAHGITKLTCLTPSRDAVYELVDKLRDVYQTQNSERLLVDFSNSGAPPVNEFTSYLFNKVSVLNFRKLLIPFLFLCE